MCIAGGWPLHPHHLGASKRVSGSCALELRQIGLNAAQQTESLSSLLSQRGGGHDDQRGTVRLCWCGTGSSCHCHAGQAILLLLLTIFQAEDLHHLIKVSKGHFTIAVMVITITKTAGVLDHSHKQLVLSVTHSKDQAAATDQQQARVDEFLDARQAPGRLAAIWSILSLGFSPSRVDQSLYIDVHEARQPKTVDDYL